MSEWYLVYCKARQEDSAARGLEEQGYEVYLPKLRVSRRRPGGAVDVEQPLFPRYLFVAPGKPWQPIGPVQYTAGVQKMVRFGVEFLPVSGDIVTALKGREDPQTGLHQLQAPAIKPGDKVRIGSGIFEGIEGVFEASSGNHRVVVLLDLLGQKTRTEVSLEELDR